MAAIWRRARAAIGFSLILLGAIGTIVPVVPGLPMILAGVALVGTEHPWIRAAARRARRIVGDREADATL